MKSKQSLILLFVMAAFSLWPVRAALADPCSWWDWFYCGTLDGCYYYANVIVTAGLTDCDKQLQIAQHSFLSEQSRSIPLQYQHRSNEHEYV